MRGRLVGTAVIVTGLVGTVAPGGAAAATGVDQVVLYRSIGPIRLGMTPAAVRAQLGASTQVQSLHGVPFSYQYVDAPQDISFTGARSHDVVDRIGADSSWRTAAGIHPGSTVTQLRRAYPSIRCYGDTCVLLEHRGAPLGPRTTFLRKDGRILAVGVFSAGD